MFSRWLRTGLLASSMLVTACSERVEEGSGLAVSETRSVPVFDEVQTRGIDVTIEVDPTAAPGTLEIRGDGNLVRLVRTRVDDGQLVIDTVDDVEPRLPLSVVVKTGRLSAIEAVGNARVVAVGRTPHLDVQLAGGARLEARRLVAQTVDVTAAGHAFATVCATDDVDLDLAGDAHAYNDCL